MAAQLAGAIAPIAISHLQSSLSKGYEGPDAVTIDSKSFTSILHGVLGTALPIVMQSLAATQKGFVPARPAVDDKGWFDSLTSVVGSVVSSPIAQAALQAAIAA